MKPESNCCYSNVLLIMNLQKFLQSLKTVKRCQLSNPHHLKPNAKIADTIITTLLTTTTTTTTILSKLTPNLVNLILSDPHLNTPKCLSFLNFLIKNQSLLSFKLNLDTHLTLVCRQLKARKFSDAENLLCTILPCDENLRYPFADIASFIENHSVNSVIAARMFNLVLKVLSDNQNFQMAFEAFDYMKCNGIEINERTCTICLIEMIRVDQLELAIEFFYRMVDGVEVSVFSVTVMVDGFCRNGEIKRGRELVEEMVGRGIQPNIVTCNVLVNTCNKRWDFAELDKVLVLMKREGVEFDIKTYRFLLDGFSSSGRIDDAEKLVLEMHDEGLELDTHSCNLVVNGYCRTGNIGKAFSFFKKMNESNVCPIGDTYWILVNGLCKVGHIEATKELVDEMLDKGIDLDFGTFDTLVDAYCREGMIDEAIRLLTLMEKKSLVAASSVYEMIISGFCKLSRMQEAELLLNTLVKRGMAAEVSNFISLIESSGYQRFVPIGIRNGVRSYSDLYTDLIMILQDRQHTKS